MRTDQDFNLYKPDSAAVFAAAMSLWNECHKKADTLIDPRVRLSDSYNGIDGLMREVMRIATLFESWSCTHINFNERDDVWPYLLEEQFGRECLSVLLPDGLSGFDESDCRRIAVRLRISFR
jgi:hypothetical protein